MPLFLLTLLGLALSLRLDWHRKDARRPWLNAIIAYLVLSLITAGYHMPENLRRLTGGYKADGADAARTYWLMGHVPRVIQTFCILWFVFQAIVASDPNRRAAQA